MEKTLLLVALLLVSGAISTGEAQDLAENSVLAVALADVPYEERWRRRFPQPVLVSDLIGRLVLDREQGVLGRIDTLVRTPEGQAQIVFTKRTFFGFGGPTVAIPAKTAALLGQVVMVLDLSEEDVRRLPVWVPAGLAAVDRTSRIRMALTKH